MLFSRKIHTAGRTASHRYRIDFHRVQVQIQSMMLQHPVTEHPPQQISLLSIRPFVRLQLHFQSPASFRHFRSHEMNIPLYRIRHVGYIPGRYVACRLDLLRRRWRKFQLNLSVQCRHLGLECFQFLLFLPCATHNLPQCWQILLQLGILLCLKMVEIKLF